MKKIAVLATILLSILLTTQSTLAQNKNRNSAPTAISKEELRGFIVEFLEKTDSKRVKKITKDTDGIRFEIEAGKDTLVIIYSNNYFKLTYSGKVDYISIEDKGVDGIIDDSTHLVSSIPLFHGAIKEDGDSVEELYISAFYRNIIRSLPVILSQ